MLTPLLLSAMILGAPDPDRNRPASLRGETVFVIKPAEMSGRRVGSNFLETATLSGTELVVQREEGDRLHVAHVSYESASLARRDVVGAREAIAFYTEKIKSNDGQNMTWLTRRSKAHEALRDLDNAIRDYDELIKLSPQSPAYWNNRANLHVRKKNFEQAQADYDKAMQLSPTTAIYHSNVANLHLIRHHPEKAMAAYDEAIRLMPTFSRALSGRSALHREKGDLPKALADAQAAVNSDARSAPARVARGMARHLSGQSAGAAEDFDKAMELDPSHAPAYLFRGIRHLDRGELQPAIRDFDTAVRGLPEYSSAMLRRSEAWAKAGNHRHALADAATALKWDPESATVVRRNAWLLATSADAEIRDGKRALELARKAVGLPHGSPGIYLDTLAAALGETGDFAEAITALKKAMSDEKYRAAHSAALTRRLADYETKKPHRE